MNKVFNNKKSNFCFIIALICLGFQYKNSDYKFILLFSAFTLIGSIIIVNTCRIVLISLMLAFSLSYITTTINTNLVIREGLDLTVAGGILDISGSDSLDISSGLLDIQSEVPSTNDFMECYPVGEQDAKYIEDGYDVSVDPAGGIKVEHTVITTPEADDTTTMDVKLTEILNQILTSPILGFIIGAGATYLVYMCGKRVWDNSIKNCINKPKI